MLKFLVEILPLAAFFIGYKTGGILTATLYILVASTISIIITYALEQKINKVNLVSTALLIASSSLTLFSGNAIFIKMKPTILYSVFAIVFLVTTFKYQPVVKYIFQSAIILKDPNHWKILNIRFMYYFIFMAIINEVVWRNFDESTWVSFKVFGAMPLTLIFVTMQIPFLMRNKIES